MKEKIILRKFFFLVFDSGFFMRRVVKLRGQFKFNLFLDLGTVSGTLNIFFSRVKDLENIL